MQIYVTKNGQQQGPYTVENLDALLQSEAITGDDLYWHEGMDSWLPLSKLPGLTPAPSTPPPPLPPPLPPPAPSTSTHSDIIGYAMLAVAAVAALLIWQSGNLGLPATALSFTAIITTAILGGVEAKQLGMGTEADKTPKGGKRSGPGPWVAVILLLWIFGFPAYLYTRSRYGARNLLLPAIVVAFALLAAPFMAARELPAVDAPEVVALAQRVISESPAVKLIGVGPVTVSNSGEVSYDKRQQKRVARAELKTKLGSEVIYYSVEWQNRSKGIIWVQIQNHP